MVNDEEYEDSGQVFDNAPNEQVETIQQSDLAKLTKEILEDDVVNDKLKDFPMWSIGSKSLKLTFLDKLDVLKTENLFEANVCRLMRSIPPCAQNSGIYQNVSEARIIFNCNLRRSQGSENAENMNERKALITQMRQLMSTPIMPKGGEGKGWLSKLLGR